MPSLLVFEFYKMSELEGIPDAICTTASFHSLDDGGPGGFRAEQFAQGHMACWGLGSWTLSQVLLIISYGLLFISFNLDMTVVDTEPLWFFQTNQLGILLNTGQNQAWALSWWSQRR